MASSRVGQKAQRMVVFLLGLRDPRVAAALRTYGFSQDDLDRGWSLLRSLGGERLAFAPEVRVDPSILERLDTWENRWFPICEATLAHNYPAVRDQVFLNLSQTDGPDLMLSVATLLDRIDALEGGDAEARAAHGMLRRRGLIEERMAEARGLLAELGRVDDAPPLDLTAMRAAQQQAEVEMWAWYREWSTIARTAIHDGRLLRRLGFGRHPAAAARAPEELDAGVGPADPADPVDPADVPDHPVTDPA